MRKVHVLFILLVVLVMVPNSYAIDGAAESQPDDLKQLAGQAVEGGNVRWKYVEVAVEWGFQEGTENTVFDGSIESSYDYGKVGAVKPLPGDTVTTMTGPQSWKSPARAGERRGIVAALLYTDAEIGLQRTIITVRTGSGSFSFQPTDLESGPILAPEYGFFVADAASKVTARDFQKELAAKDLKTIRQRVRELPEQTWARAMQAIHGEEEFPPPPAVPYEPQMTVEVPDANLTSLWRIGAWQIIKYCGPDDQGNYVVYDHPFGPIALEVDRILWSLDQMGMHKVAADGMGLWLKNQQPDGMLLTNHDHDKLHAAGALAIPWVMAEHYRLTGDAEWLKAEAPRLKAGAQWILNHRRATMKETLSPEEREGLKTGTWAPYGLQPPIKAGDADTVRGTVLCYFFNDGFAYQSVKLLTGVMEDVDPQFAKELAAETENYRHDIQKVLDETLALSPVVKTRDGRYHSFLPQGFHYRGTTIRALPEGVDRFSHCGPYSSDVVVSSTAIESWLRSGLLAIDDPRIDGHFEVLEDVYLADNPWVRARTNNYDPEQQWFSHGGFGYQSGWERVPDYYLVKDDIPNFLRAWLNRCAVDLNPQKGWTFNEHTEHADNDKSHGNAVFLSNFRNMLVMEIDDQLWLARGTPRAWLEQGKKILVKNSPTHFGTAAYEIVSDVEHGKIAATVEMPSRIPPQSVWLRFRHPKAAPIQSVTVNGKVWTDFDRDKEVIRLVQMQGTVTVEATY